jgi:hypothetical protein
MPSGLHGGWGQAVRRVHPPGQPLLPACAPFAAVLHLHRDVLHATMCPHEARRQVGLSLHYVNTIVLHLITLFFALMVLQLYFFGTKWNKIETSSDHFKMSIFQIFYFN